MLAADEPTGRLPLDVVSLSRLMERTAGIPAVVVGLIDGPVAANHADLATEGIRWLPSPVAGPSERAPGAARHGTYVAGILSAPRESAAPAICPRCTLLVRPIFLEPAPGNVDTPSASPGELADAIVDCRDAGARILNPGVAPSDAYLMRRLCGVRRSSSWTLAFFMPFRSRNKGGDDDQAMDDDGCRSHRSLDGSWRTGRILES
jgi:hypothetical protein